MKNAFKHLLGALLIVSLACNALLSFHVLQKKESLPSIIKLGYDMHDTFIYCEKSENTDTVKLDYTENSFTIGKSKILCAGDSVYFVNDTEQIRLSDYEGYGFVINSNGELLYSLNAPTKKQETVYITPSDKKYHKDRYCAGKTGFEMEIETAKLLREPCSLCT